MENIRKRIFITIGLLAIYWIGRYIPVFGINYSALVPLFKQMIAERILQRLSIFSQGIISYTSAHIIILLFTAAIPYFRRLSTEHETGIKKINQTIIFTTILLSLVYSFFISLWILEFHPSGGTSLVLLPPYIFQFLAVLTITLGTIIIIWMGRLITNFGIGNGISLFILLGILSNFSRGLSNVWKYVCTKNSQILFLFLIIIILLLAIIVKYILSSEKKIQLRYAGHKIGNIYLSLSLNQAGIMPIIFASSVWLFPTTLVAFQGKVTESFLNKVSVFLQQGPVVISYLIYAILIIFFTFFYTAVVFNPLQLSAKMKKVEASIPNVEPGISTAKYLGKILMKITLLWGLFLFTISSLLTLLPYWLKIPLFNLDGVNLILLVGIILESWRSLSNKLRFKAVFSHPDLKEILLVKGLLESEGISSVIDNMESFGRLLCLTIGPLAMKRILVRQEDFNRAREVIANNHISHMP